MRSFNYSHVMKSIFLLNIRVDYFKIGCFSINVTIEKKELIITSYFSKRHNGQLYCIDSTKPQLTKIERKGKGQTVVGIDMVGPRVVTGRCRQMKSQGPRLLPSLTWPNTLTPPHRPHSLSHTASPPPPSSHIPHNIGLVTFEETTPTTSGPFCIFY